MEPSPAGISGCNELAMRFAAPPRRHAHPREEGSNRPGRSIYRPFLTGLCILWRVQEPIRAQLFSHRCRPRTPSLVLEPDRQRPPGAPASSATHLHLLVDSGASFQSYTRRHENKQPISPPPAVSFIYAPMFPCRYRPCARYGYRSPGPIPKRPGHH